MTYRDQLKAIKSKNISCITEDSVVETDGTKWVTVKSLAEANNTTVNTILNRAKRGEYEAKTLLGLIVIKA